MDNHALIGQSAQQLLNPSGSSPMSQAINTQGVWGQASNDVASNPAYSGGFDGLSALTAAAGGTAGNTGAYTAPAANTYGGYGSAAGQQSAIGGFTDQLNNLNQDYSMLGQNQQNGMDSINRGYTDSNSQLTDSNNRAMSNLATQRQDSQANYSKQDQQINNNARTGFNSLQALLGGTGSAGSILAPYAVSNQANQQKSGAADAYAQNLRGLDTADKNAATQFTAHKQTLDNQKNSQLQSLLSSIDQQKIQYQQQIGSLNNSLNMAKGGQYAAPTAQNDAIAGLRADQQNLIKQYQNPAYTPQTVNANPVSLQDYKVQAANLGGLNNQPDPNAANTDTNAALQSLLNLQKQNTNQYQL